MLEYLQKQNRKFYTVTSLQRFTDWRNELNKLYLEGKIKVRNGINGQIIELL